jgi:hypothetical protein
MIGKVQFGKMGARIRSWTEGSGPTHSAPRAKERQQQCHPPTATRIMKAVETDEVSKAQPSHTEHRLLQVAFQQVG